jgi:hypothetical protein
VTPDFFLTVAAVLIGCVLSGALGFIVSAIRRDN